MPFTLTPTYRHSRKRAAVALARRGDLAEAARVGRVPLGMVQTWLAEDQEFRALFERAQRRARRQAFRRLLKSLSGAAA